jgi:hypothetical protein
MMSVELTGDGAPNRHAVIIANPLPKGHDGYLPNAERDARLVAEEFRSAGFTLYVVGGDDAINLNVPKAEFKILFSGFRKKVLESPATAIVVFITGHGRETARGVEIKDSDGKYESISEHLAPLMALSGLKTYFLDTCREIADEPGASHDCEGDLTALLAKHPHDNNLMILATECGGHAYDGRAGTNSHLTASLYDLLRTGDEHERVSAFLKRVARDVASRSSGRQFPVVLGDRPATIEYTMNPWRKKMEYPKTGADLMEFRGKSKLDTAAFAASINRLPGWIATWEAARDEPLPPSIVRSLPRYYEANGTAKKLTDDGDPMHDDFNDYDGTALARSQDLLRHFNALTLDSENMIDRIGLTDTRDARANGDGTIWLASNEARSGRHIGDRQFRRIVADFHVRSRGDNRVRFLYGDRPNNADAERHSYIFDDPQTGRKFACSIKAIEHSSRPENSENYIVAVSSAGAPKSGFNQQAEPMRRTAQAFLKFLKMLD